MKPGGIRRPMFSSAALVLWCVALAILIRWPLSYYLWALPLDSNISLHILAAQDLHRTGDPLTLSSLSFPDAIPFRMLAWPTVLVASWLETWMSPVRSMNVALVLLVAVQGLAMAALGRTLGWNVWQRLAAATAVEAAPVTVTLLANSQVENLAFFAFCLVVWGVKRGGPPGWLSVLGGLVLAGYSSPYQAVPAALLVVTMALGRGVRALVLAGATSVLAAVLVGVYFSGAILDGARPASGPRRSVPVWDAANAKALLIPNQQPLDPQHDVSDLLSPAARWQAVTHRPPVVEVHIDWHAYPPWRVSYLGIVLVAAGLGGLWVGRKDRTTRAVAAAGAVCLVLSFAPHAGLVERLGREGVGAASWGAILEPVLYMRSPVRFLTATCFALALGVGHLVGKWRPLGTLALMAGLMADSLLLAPGTWPPRCVYPDVHALEQRLNQGPIAVWPPFHSEYITAFQVLAVTTGRRLGICEPTVATRDAVPDRLWKGLLTIAPPPEPHSSSPPPRASSSTGRTTAEWLRQLYDAGATVLVELLPEPEVTPPLSVLDPTRLGLRGAPTCFPGYCLWDLATQLEPAAPSPEPDGDLVIRCR